LVSKLVPVGLERLTDFGAAAGADARRSSEDWVAHSQSVGSSLIRRRARRR
jgi:hypothetical protein